MLLSIPAGATSKIIQIPIFDSSSTTGALLTGLAYNTASLTAYYNLEGAAGAATAITLATATKGTWATGGFVAVDGTNMPGWYELHIPNAALTGAKSVSIHLKGATNMVPVPILIELTATSNQDAVRGGMTAFPNVSSGSAGALIVSGTGTAALSVSSGLVTLAGVTHTGAVIPTVTTTATATNVTTVNGLAANVITAAATAADFGTEIASAVWQDAVAGDFTVASSIGKSLYTGNVAPGGTNGLMISGTNSGTTTLGALTITGATTHTGNVVLSDGLTISAPSTLNRSGFSITGNGTGSALTLAAGSTGKGIAITTTAGDGISVLPTAGHGIVATGNGTSKHGAIITGGTAGTSDGISAIAGTGGVDIRGNITGNIVGTLSTLTTYTGNTPQSGDAYARLGAPAGASVSADVAAVKVDAAAILDDTGTTGVVVASGSKTGYSLTATTGLGNQTGAVGSVTGAVGSVTAGVTVGVGGIATTSFAASAIDAAALSTDAGQEIADAMLLRKLDRTGTGNDTAQERTVVNALRAIRNKASISGGTLTVTKEDDTTTAWTAAVTTAAGNPISGVDPT